jgi:hypothetical protein
MVDPGSVLDDLLDRPVGDPLAVGEAAPYMDVAVRPKAFEHLREQATLPDAWRTDQGHERRPALGIHRPAEAEDALELVLPADEASLDRPGGECGAVPGCHNLPDRHRLRLPLRRDGLGLAKLELVSRGAVGQLADEDPVDGRG